jgi:hypothetical protein
MQRHFRYARTPEQEEFLKLVATTSDSRSLTMKGGFILWRAQLGHDWRTQERDGASFDIPLRLFLRTNEAASRKSV